MRSETLTKDNPTTKPFTMRGDGYICAIGKGQIVIKRKMGNKFVPVTTELGDEMAFGGEAADSLIFNGCVTCKAPIEHIVEAKTSDQIVVTIALEK